MYQREKDLIFFFLKDSKTSKKKDNNKGEKIKDSRILEM
jgi:hypothetical protein